MNKTRLNLAFVQGAFLWPAVGRGPGFDRLEALADRNRQQIVADLLALALLGGLGPLLMFLSLG